MKIKFGRLKYIGLFLFLFAIYLAAASQPPSLPLVVYGKVSYESGEPAEGIAVTAKWIDEKSQSQHFVVSTLTKNEAIAIGHPNLAGQYKFFEDDIYLGSNNMVSIESAGKIVVTNIIPGIITEAPNIILPISPSSSQGPKGGNFVENIADKVAVLLGYEEANQTSDYETYGQGYGNYSQDNHIQQNENVNNSQQEEALQNFTSMNNTLYEESKEKIKRTDLIYIGEKHSPIIEGLNNTFYFCEGQEVLVKFNITDADYDPLNIGIFPDKIFNVSPEKSFNERTVSSRMYSNKLAKKDIGSHNLLVFAYDNAYVDTKNLTINVIEINNPPKLEDMGVITIPLSQIKAFNYKLRVKDIEEGDEDSGNLNFSLNFIKGMPFFNIDKKGTINVGLHDNLRGFYYISICVRDNGLKKISEDISLCNQEGGPIKVCKNMSLTIIEDNHEPTIISQYPLEENLNFEAGSLILFNISTNDPDGTITDAYWYVDGNFKKRDSNTMTDQFSYSFDCYDTGPHKIRAEITDGIINKSTEWNLNIHPCKLMPEKIGTLAKIEKKYPGFFKKIFWIFIFILGLIFLYFIIHQVITGIKLKKELEKDYGKNV